MRVILIAASILSVLSSCDYFDGKRIPGNGKITTQQRNVGSFNSIDVSGAIDVHIRQDSSASVKVETDENLLEFLEVYTNGNALVIKTKSGYNLDPTKDVIVYATAPQLKNIDASGSCDIIGDNVITTSDALGIALSGSGSVNLQVNLPKLSTKISGSGNVVLKGTAKEFEGNISGSGSIKAFDLITDNSSLDLSGSADAQITANQKLDIEVSGSGDVEYKGNAVVSQSISGSGSVKKIPLSP